MTDHLAGGQQDPRVRFPEDVIGSRDHEFEVAIEPELSGVGKHRLGSEPGVADNAHRETGSFDLFEDVLGTRFDTCPTMCVSEDFLGQLGVCQGEFQPIDVVDVVLFFLEQTDVHGIYNVGTGQARSWNDLANALFQAVGQTPDIEYIEMPETLRKRYQYFTEADMTNLRKAGYKKSFTSLEAGG